MLRGKTRTKDVILDYCRRCRGVWFDEHELEEVLDVAAKDLRPPGKSEDRRIACPKCNKVMTAFYYPQTRVLVDQCGKCRGVWLDGREFAEIKTVRENMRKRNLLEEYAPVLGLKGVLIRFIESAIDQLQCRE